MNDVITIYDTSLHLYKIFKRESFNQMFMCRVVGTWHG